MVRDFPLLLISYNRLSYLRQQVDYFRSIGFSRIVILDNASTYEPLLVWLDQIETQNVVVERLKENLGPGFEDLKPADLNPKTFVKKQIESVLEEGEAKPKVRPESKIDPDLL